MVKSKTGRGSFKKTKHVATGARSLEAIAGRLTVTRQALGLSPAELCRAADIPPNTYSQYEGAVSRINLDNALRLVDVFGLSLDWIYRGEAGELRSGLLEKIKAQM